MKVFCDVNGNKKILLPKDIDTSFSSHTLLSNFAQEVNSIKGQQLIVNFQKVRFIASNQFAVLGCIMSGFINKNEENRLLVEGLSVKIKNIVSKNGFSKHLGIDRLSDEHNTVIPYRIFDVAQINEYERYLTISLFGREDLPQMSQLVKNSIQDYLLELFKNVKDHTTSDHIFTCGQFFPMKKFLYFTIVDSGETIPFNVKNHFKKCNMDKVDNYLYWAIQEGNSTRESYAPGGLGLSLIKDFVSLNEGELHIVSGEDIFEYNCKGERCRKMDYSFPGTIVTIAFNLGDESQYCFIHEDMDEIEF